MKFKKEKGFKKIEIEDSEFQKKSCINIYSTKCLIFLIIIGIFILIFLVFELLLIIQNKGNFDFPKNIYNLRNEHIFKTNEKKEFFERTKRKKKENINKTIEYNLKKRLISIIIIVEKDNKEEEIEKLLNSIYNQIFSDFEIIIVDDFNKYRNNSINYEKFKKTNKKIQILNLEKNIGKFRKRIEGVNKSEGEYLIFMDSDDSFHPQTNILEKIYNNAIENNVDILEFKSYHQINCKDSKPIYQPELFDLMYFKKDDFYNLKQFHITGKLIKKELYLYTLENIDNFYKEQNMNYYEESMFLFILFKNANSFELIKMDSTNKICKKCDYNLNFQTEQMKKDFLLYLKFLLQYSDTVPEKRMISSLFIKTVDYRFRFDNEESDKLIKDIFNIYLTCEKINEYEQKRVKLYENSILKKA